VEGNLPIPTNPNYMGRGRIKMRKYIKDEDGRLYRIGTGADGSPFIGTRIYLTEKDIENIRCLEHFPYIMIDCRKCKKRKKLDMAGRKS